MNLDLDHLTAQDGRRLGVQQVFTVDRRLKVGELLAEAVEGGGVEFHHVVLAAFAGHLGGQGPLFPLQFHEFCLDGIGAESFGGEVNQIGDPLVDGGHAAFRLRPFGYGISSQTFALGMIFSNVGGDHLGSFQLALQGLEDPLLQDRHTNGASVLAGPGFLVGGAAQHILSLDGVGSAAAAAADQTGQGMLRTDALVDG